MESTIKNIVTVQGFGTPVPAASGSEQAGSQPSSSFDCNTVVVDSLATTVDNSTRIHIDGVRNSTAFGRSAIMQRSPQTSPLGGNKTANVAGGIIVMDAMPAGVIRRSSPQRRPTVIGTSKSTVVEIQEALGDKYPIKGHAEQAQDAEEEEIRKCVTYLKQMKAATVKQKNIGMPVKNGIILLEESLDKIQNLRLSWKGAEKIQKTQHTQTSPTVQAESLSKHMEKRRVASSTAKGENNKKGKTDMLANTIPNIERVVEEDTVSTLGNNEYLEPWETVRNGKKKQMKNAKTTQADKQELQDTNPQASKITLGRSRRVRRQAICIKPVDGQTYASVLQGIKSKFDPEAVGAEIKGIRQTKNGSLLLELSNKTKDPGKLNNMLKEVVGDSGDVKCLTPTTSLEIRNLDCLTETEDVKHALERDLGDLGEIGIYVTEPNNRGH